MRNNEKRILDTFPSKNGKPPSKELDLAMSPPNTGGRPVSRSE